MENTIKFNSRKEVEKYLVDVMSDLNKKGEFNIFVHQINSYQTHFERGKNILEKKIEGILRDGLTLSAYASIFGTTNLACSSFELNPNPILDYDYYRGSNFPICVIAIPKYIDVDGEKTEFSTYQSNTAEIREQIRHIFFDNGFHTSNHNIKSSLFDVIKEYKDLPNYYVLGVMNQGENNFTFVENPQHLKMANKKEFKKYQQSVSNKIKDAYEEYGTKDPVQLMVKSYQKEHLWRDEQLLDYD